MTKLGLVSISFRHLSAEEIVFAAKEAGLSCIEWGSDVHAPCADQKKLEDIVKLQEREGISCCSYGTYFRLGVDRTEELLPYIEAAKLLGTDILRLWCGDKGSALYTKEELEALCEQCRAAEKLARKCQVRLCMECHNNTLTDAREPSLALMKALDSPHFRMYWQPNQWRTAAENQAYIEALAPYTEHVHVFNWKKNDRFRLEEAVGQWKRWLEPLRNKAARSVVGDGAAWSAADGTDRALLLEFMPDDRVESLGREAAALRRIAEVWNQK